MGTIPLIREALRPLYQVAQDAHTGLLLQRGMMQHDGNDQQGKRKHIERVCSRTAGEFYRRAYERWDRTTSDKTRFRSVCLRLRNRLFIGLTGGGLLETGCAIHQTYGAPFIPGSSVKGLVAAHARDRLGEAGCTTCDELFGMSAADDDSTVQSGLIAFHDAWWVPNSESRPLVQEVVTTHHPEYYGTEGSRPATDCDSPIPNAQVAVQGEFLFVVEGRADWLNLSNRMLISALTLRGAGAKTRTGYGLFEAPADPGSTWVERKISELSAKPGVTADDTLHGKALAEHWNGIEDTSLKRAAFAEIRDRWTEKGWWNDPPGRTANKAKAIYAAWQTEQGEVS